MCTHLSVTASISGGDMQFHILVSSCFKWMHKIVSNLSNVSFDILKKLICFASSCRSFPNSVLNAPNLNRSTGRWNYRAPPVFVDKATRFVHRPAELPFRQEFVSWTRALRHNPRPRKTRRREYFAIPRILRPRKGVTRRFLFSSVVLVPSNLL
jgi:hypothetical protein